MITNSPKSENADIDEGNYLIFISDVEEHLGTQKILSSTLKTNRFIDKINIQMTPSSETLSNKLSSDSKHYPSHRAVYTGLKTSRILKAIEKDEYITSLAKYNSYSAKRRNNKRMLEDIKDTYLSSQPIVVQNSLNDFHSESIEKKLNRYSEINKDTDLTAPYLRKSVDVDVTSSKSTLRSKHFKPSTSKISEKAINHSKCHKDEYFRSDLNRNKKCLAKQKALKKREYTKKYTIDKQRNSDFQIKKTQMFTNSTSSQLYKVRKGKIIISKRLRSK